MSPAVLNLMTWVDSVTPTAHHDDVPGVLEGYHVVHLVDVDRNYYLNYATSCHRQYPGVP